MIIKQIPFFSLLLLFSFPLSSCTFNSTNSIQTSSPNNDESLSETTLEELCPLLSEVQTNENKITKYDAEYNGSFFSLFDNLEDIINQLNSKGIDYKFEDDYINVESALILYFDKNNTCTRISFLNSLPKTNNGIHEGDSISTAMDFYGNNYTETIYVDRGLYAVYRYEISNSIFEFGIYEPTTDMDEVNFSTIDNVEIYCADLFPLYDYGPTLEESGLFD